MAFPLFYLIGGTLTVLFGIAFGIGGQTVVPACLAVALTLPPAVVTLLATAFVSRRRPLAGPPVVMLGTGFRMLVTVAMVVLLRGRAADFGTTATALARWTTGFYLLTLALETVLLAGLLTSPPAEDGKHESSAN